MTYDTVIVGSGIAGLSAAYRLAPDHDVLVVDRAGIGEGTSSRASGVLTAPVDYPDQPEWAAHATEFFRDLDGTGTFDWIDREYVRGVRPDDRDNAEESAAVDGIEIVDVEECGDVFDDNAPYDRALVWEDCGYCDVDDLLATLYSEASRRGVEFRPDTTVTSVRVTDGAATAVKTEYGTVEADTVVVAVGSTTRNLLADVLELPIRTFTWNVAYLDADLDDGYPMGGDPNYGAYWRGTDDEQLLVGVEHCYESEPPSEEEAFGDRLDAFIRDELGGLLAAVDAETDVVRYEVCPMADATTPDAKGIIDAPKEGPDDLVVAAGFHGAGVMAAGSIGTAIRSLATVEEAPFDLEPFRLDRFDVRGTDFEFASMFATEN
ncbi:NAD(P)/FAD-dependent oxidoreductase [Natrinema gelatinilyticum]|uniref:NAD(P)/FAD-dependent oxidoreductase n=1 Tax=Natrinema gelatinilyticum TaxID=2961571 RepID=UPI0020C31329|nr:FAD-binding oxidoreductase [Natrinema gelatinilyticum]